METPEANAGFTSGKDEMEQNLQEVYFTESNEMQETLNEEVSFAESRISFWRNITGFWFLGLCNNFAYVVMLSAAQDILNKQYNSTGVSNSSDDDLETLSANSPSTYDCNPISTGAILLADVVPSLILKITAPLFLHHVPYSIRVVTCALFSSGSFLVVSFSVNVAMSLTGVVFASFSSGLGEVTFLSLSTFFNRHVISGWSSGTGAAGLVGSLTYLGFTQAHISPENTLLIMLVVPAFLIVSYWIVLVFPPECPAGSTCGFARSQSNIHITAPSNRMTYREKWNVFQGLMSHMSYLGLVYLAEYFINQGLVELLYFHNISLTHDEQYRWYQALYQAGVFISRSSLKIIHIKKTWILALLQCVNAVFIFFAAYYRFLPSIFIVFPIIVYEGLLGGASYVNTFNNIRHEVNENHCEFALGVTSVADSIGIALAGAIAIPVHNAICER
uniref:battenin-like isoform X2 n=1 Tax=Myxine glutinosa TaxID=7769 RepID=UPI00358E1256